MSAYYNEFDPYAAQWLRNLISAGHIAPGEVDERSIIDVRPDELRGFTQCHFFAGIGGWSLAARMAGWPDERPMWTGSCPCQPYSLVGKQEGFKDERDLWPVWFGLVDAVQPTVVMGEQVKDAIGKDWLDRMRFDLERSGYSIGATVLPACAVDAPHRRDRLWFVADDAERRRGGQSDQACSEWKPEGQDRIYSGGSALVYGEQPRLEGQSGHGYDRRQPGRFNSQANGPTAETGDIVWLVGADGKARRVKSGVRLLAHGVPARVGKLRAYGNAIVPQVAAQVIAAYMECRP